MLITKTNPVGIDSYIQQFQNKLHTMLMLKWDNPTYHCYGRSYRNKTEDGYIAEVFTDKNEYKEVYWNDTLDAISFFGIGDSIEEQTTSTIDVHLVFFVNLKKLKPSIAHRADEEVRQDVQSVFGKGIYSFTYTSTVLYLENVLREYPGSRRDDRLKFIDMHPVHCFRFNFKLSFDPTKNCSTIKLK